jgi:hypothetical protein
VVLQYTRRRTALARSIVAATLVLAAATAYAPVWGGAFAIQKMLFSAVGDWNQGRPGGLPHVPDNENETRLKGTLFIEREGECLRSGGSTARSSVPGRWNY